MLWVDCERDLLLDLVRMVEGRIGLNGIRRLYWMASLVGGMRIGKVGGWVVLT